MSGVNGNKPPEGYVEADENTWPTMTIAGQPEDGHVLLVFDRTVDHVALHPEAAVATAKVLCQQAKVAGFAGNAFVMVGNGANFAAQLADVEKPKTVADVVGGEWADREDQWTEAIGKAHPTITGKHDVYTQAMAMVGARKSKGSLVELVNWLLVERANLMDAYDNMRKFAEDNGLDTTTQGG